MQGIKIEVWNRFSRQVGEPNIFLLLHFQFRKSSLTYLGLRKVLYEMCRTLHYSERVADAKTRASATKCPIVFYEAVEHGRGVCAGSVPKLTLPIDVQGGMFYLNVTCGKKLRYLGVNPISTKLTLLTTIVIFDSVHKMASEVFAYAPYDARVLTTYIMAPKMGLQELDKSELETRKNCADIETRAHATKFPTAFCEAFGPGFVFERVYTNSLYKIMKEHKNPKVLSEDSWKDLGLQSSTAATRNATIKLLGFLKPVSLSELLRRQFQHAFGVIGSCKNKSGRG
ncbi:hypothetical protein ISN44_As13g009040 [Arabidopsis suecica]|uniref:Uncharacterized protein n=1 Tax=Arabidopsis suecica TaxID=45249 RepID=A0A8T1XWN8_ARASU|nr:hypothetical protein ISN44_As13g009040 [Arabidopsis suecica]